MSGEAGASVAGNNYSIFVGCGINVSVAISPDGTGDEVGEYFERESAPYVEWLSRAKPALDVLFANNELPLAPLSGSFEQVDGTVIDDPDRNANHFRTYHRGGPLRLDLNGVRRLAGFRSLHVVVHVTRRVLRAEVDSLLDRIAAILEVAGAPD